MFETMWYLYVISLWYLILCRECDILLSSLGLLLWWWSLIALIVIITPFVSTTSSWYWYDLYSFFLYLALVLSLQLLGASLRVCVLVLSLESSLYLAHIQGELAPSIAKIAFFLCKSVGLSSNTKKGEIERTISSHDVFGVK